MYRNIYAGQIDLSPALSLQNEGAYKKEEKAVKQWKP